MNEADKWRAEVTHTLAEHAAKLEKLGGADAEHAAQLGSMRAELSENTSTTRRIDENTRGLLEMMQSWAGAMSVIQSVGRFFKPLSYIAVFVSALAGAYAALKSGVTPK